MRAGPKGTVKANPLDFSGWPRGRAKRRERFIGEYLILIGSFLSARWWVVIAATGVILAALYLLWAYQRVFHGEPDESNAGFAELKLREGALLLPFVVAIVFIGIYPQPLLDRIEPSVDRLIAHVEQGAGFESPEPDVVEAEPASEGG